jgi:hypothetical protein
LILLEHTPADTTISLQWQQFVFFRGVVVILCCIFSAAGSSQDALADTGRVAWVRDPESGNQTC